ncbi:MAG: M48 family metallopeptidase [Zoogloeaceae bacterium]|jgi:Zn-dependent protease with chaperone function|nr:M48 family metallopeptidase [Zoogloeaceae bacterium]
MKTTGARARFLLGALLLLGAVAGCQTTGGASSAAAQSGKTSVGKTGTIGVEVGEPSSFRSMVPAAELEKQAGREYQALIREAKQKGALATGTASGKRVAAIAQRIILFAPRFNEEAKNWKWEVHLIADKTVNAFCMPGGKIAFYTGLVDGLKLSDDEIAIVMGHEAAHALREHARSQIGKNQATSLGVGLLGKVVGGGKYEKVFEMGGNLLSLKFSRNDESEADMVGLDLAARAGFDPRAGVTLWKKMDAASGGGASLSWLSTHPSSSSRIQEIEATLPRVLPLYEAAEKPAAKKKG